MRCPFCVRVLNTEKFCELLLVFSLAQASSIFLFLFLWWPTSYARLAYLSAVFADDPSCVAGFCQLVVNLGLGILDFPFQYFVSSFCGSLSADGADTFLQFVCDLLFNASVDST